jgi:D-sedoheptulose 7-phosphate isomerase
MQLNKINSEVDQFSTYYKKNLSNIINNISNKEIEDFINILLQTRKKKATVYFIGNGGSASTASHFVNDLSIGLKTLGNPFRAVSLCDNMSVITAIGNDFGYEYIFSKQLEVLLKKGDLVVAISASGNSKNIIQAINTAKDKLSQTVGISAFGGGMLKTISDISVHVPTKEGEYGVAEDAHLMLDHLVTGYLAKYISIEE